MTPYWGTKKNILFHTKATIEARKDFRAVFPAGEHRRQAWQFKFIQLYNVTLDRNVIRVGGRIRLCSSTQTLTTVITTLSKLS